MCLCKRENAPKPPARDETKELSPAQLVGGGKTNQSESTPENTEAKDVAQLPSQKKNAVEMTVDLTERVSNIEGKDPIPKKSPSEIDHKSLLSNY